MSMPNTDTRALTLVDIPLVKRLSETGTVLNSQLGLTRDARGPNSALLSSILFARELHTLVARSDTHQVVGQFRHKQDEPNAYMVYLAPGIEDNADDTVWLHILDAMAREAGKQGAHTLIAEVEENSPLFETMRTAGFAVYARQVIWRLEPRDHKAGEELPEVTEQQPRDHLGMCSLLNSTIPAMIQPVVAPHGDMRGLVYRVQGRIEGHIAVSEGKQGVYLLPHLHPDILGQAAAVIEAAIQSVHRANKVPVYICVRAYQNWLDSAVQQMGFEPWIDQAIMVKHLAAGIRNPGFATMRLTGVWETVRGPILPPASHSTVVDDQLACS